VNSKCHYEDTVVHSCC